MVFVLCVVLGITAVQVARHLSGISTDTKLSYRPSVDLRPGPIELGSSSNRVVLRMFTPLLGWALGPPGKGPGIVHDAVLQTMDGGAHWRNLTPPGFTGDTDRAEYFLDMNHAWVAVAPALASASRGPTTVTVFRTSNGARSWQRATFPVSSGSPAQLDFVDPEHGWLVIQALTPEGIPGVAAYRTLDGGIHWQAVSLPEAITVGGLNFGRLPVPDMIHARCELIPFTAVSFVDPLTGWGAGLCDGGPPRVYIQMTRDGAVSWHEMALPDFPESVQCPCVTSATLPAFTSRNDGTFVVGVQTYVTTCLPQPRGGIGCQSESRPTASILYRTHDGGLTWTARPLPALSPAGDDVYFLDGSNGLFAGARYSSDPALNNVAGMAFESMYVTHDGGATWAVLPVRGPFQGGSLQFVNPSAGWALKFGRLLRTADAGRTWTMLVPVVSS